MFKKAKITDNLSNLLSETIHKLETKAENKVKKEYLRNVKQGKIINKKDIGIKLAEAALNNPEGKVKDVIYPVVSPETLKEFIEDLQNNDKDYNNKVYKLLRSSYQRHYRQSIPKIIEVLGFNSNNDIYKPMIRGIELITRLCLTK